MKKEKKSFLDRTKKCKKVLRKAIACANKGWEPDWLEYGPKYLFASVLESDKGIAISHHLDAKYQPDWMYMKTQEIAEEILANYSTEIIIVLSE